MASGVDDVEGFDAHDFKYMCCCGEVHGRSGALMLGYGGVATSILVPLYLYMFTYGHVLMIVAAVYSTCLLLSSVVLLGAVYCENDKLLVVPQLAALAWFLLTSMAAVVSSIWIASAELEATESILRLVATQKDQGGKFRFSDASAPQQQYATSTTEATELLLPDDDYPPRPTMPPESVLARQMRAWRVVILLIFASLLSIPQCMTLMAFKSFLVDKRKAIVKNLRMAKRKRSQMESLKWNEGPGAGLRSLRTSSIAF